MDMKIAQNLLHPAKQVQAILGKRFHKDRNGTLGRAWRMVLFLTVALASILLGHITARAATIPRFSQEPIAPNAARQPSALATAFVQVVAGDEHSCGLTTSGGVLCWGDNADGQAGDGTNFPYRPPVAVTGRQSGVQALVANGSHSCAVLSSGGVVCWGGNRAGQLGDGTVAERRVPVPVLELSAGVTTLAAGGSHTCALLQSGTVRCWGSNQAGQLGNGTTQDTTTPVNVTGLTTGVIALTAGASHTCALLQTGTLQCWGANANGQLGDGTTTARTLPTPVSGLAGAVQGLAAGSEHTCAILSDGRLQCWGDNARGQLGDGTREDRSTPTLVNQGSDRMAVVTAGRYHSCALAIDGDLYCWGANNRGQLATSTVDSSRTPLRITGVPGDAVAVTAGLDHVCAIFKAKTVYCWGSNRARQLGQDAPAVESVPTFLQLAALPNGQIPQDGIPAIVGGRYHTCLITPSRGVQCWGRNSDGQVGDGTQLPRTQPTAISTLTSGTVALALGAEHSCALRQDSTVHCWGSNQTGQLGDGTTTERLIPTPVTGLTGNLAALVAGDNHTCVLAQPGGAKCWGANQTGQLGDGTTTPSGFPVTVAGLTSGVVALSAGSTHTCALRQSGGVQCWGANQAGQLGDGTTLMRTTPVDVIGLSGIIALDAGDAHTCAIQSGGTVYCWGANNKGQLGTGDRLPRAEPVAVIGLPSAALAIAAGAAHSCVILTDGALFCWGGNEYSQLGDGTTADRLTPVGVSGLAARGLALQAGGYHTCALVTGNRPLCWGRDSDGQLGTGIIAQSSELLLLEESTLPQVQLSSLLGAPGSTFTLIGSGFPYSSTLPLLVNGTTLTETLAINPSGALIIYFTTTAATPGGYTIQLGKPPLASLTLLIQEGSAIRPPEGAGTTLALPSGLAQPLANLYLPLVER
ncbi:MAG: hypothetical protein KF832_15290 [Caldilineaceae bacterium]|nr:hypothetical protein [Caldilineaceae bacterium]